MVAIRCHGRFVQKKKIYSQWRTSRAGVQVLLCGTLELVENKFDRWSQMETERIQ